MKRNGPYIVKRILEKEFSSLKKRIPEFSTLRIGKNFECGSKHSRPELLQVLQYCIKYEVRPILVSKTLEFDPEVAELVRKGNGTIHISLGNDSMERGAVEQGFTNEQRYTNAKLYRDAGVVCYVRIVEDITLPMPEFIKRINSEQFPILLTPLYYKDNATYERKREGLSWKEAKSSGIYKFENGALHPVIMHDDWKNVRERCGIIRGKMACNNCSLKTVTFSQEVGTSKKLYHQKLIQVEWN